MKPPVQANNLDFEMTTSKDVRQYMAFAKDGLVDATKSFIYVGRIAPLDLADPCFDIF
jgi:hypothetical protein